MTPVASTILPDGGLHLGEFLPPIVACGIYVLLYLRRTQTLARRQAPVARWRITCFLAGASLMAIVQIGPVDSLADQILLVHMAQHIVLGDLCSLLLVLGLTGPVLAPLLHLRFTRPIRILSHPIVALVLWALDLYGWHVPLLYQLAIRHDLVHALEHACLLWFGSLLWLALIGPLPKPAWFGGWYRLSYIVVVRVLGAVLGNVFIWTQTVLYPVYRASDAARGLKPLSDQNIAGGLMMIEQMLLTTVLLGWLFLRFLRQDERRQELVDVAATRGIALSDDRAARAAASGHAGHLRDRLLAEPGQRAPERQA